MQKNEKRVRAILVVLAMCFGGSVANAADPPPKTYQIGPQSVSAALQAFAAQADMQLIFTEKDAGGAKSGGVTGTKSPREALQEILKGTGLEFEFTANNVVVVKKASAAVLATKSSDPPDENAEDRRKEGKRKSSDGFRVAQVDQGQTSGPATVGTQNQQATKTKPAPLEEVVVTGSRIPEAQGQGAQPVRTYSRDDIERSGETTVTDFLNTLPDVSVAGPQFFATSGISHSGQTTVQLHGLPVGTTLVLLNGRRVEDNDNGFFDLGNIPVSAIERMEILPVGASAIYGADALGGAVNIILRTDVDGFEAVAKGGHASGQNDTSGNLAWGKHWDQGSVSIVATLQDRGELIGSERLVTSTTNFPGAQAQPFWAVDYYCSPGTVYSLNGTNLPGLSSAVAGIPQGVTGTPTIAQFVPTAGRVNLCNAYHDSGLIPSTQREGLMLAAHQQANESLDVFSEVLLSHNEQRTDLGPLLYGEGAPPFTFTTIDAANPYNPFGQTVGVSFAYPNALDNTLTYSSTFVRPLVGIRGSLIADWHYEATGYFSQDRFNEENPNLNSTALQTALDSSNPATALNPFTSGEPGSTQLLQSLLASPSLTNELNRRVGAQAFLRGPVMQLPAGPLQTVLGMEYGHESLSEQTQGLGANTNLDLRRITYSAFTEAKVPLVAASSPGSEIDRLALTVAGRYDHSSDYGGKATWQSTLTWRPTTTLLLRGGYATSYEAPLLSEIGGGLQFSSTGDVGLVDPFRGGAPVGSLTLTQASNPNLKPQTGDATTLGIVYSSEVARGFEASLSYFSIHLSNYIFIPLAQTLIDYPDDFPGAVVRNPPTAQDLQNGFLGQIRAVNDSYFNFGNILVRGFDADVKYAIDTARGQLTPSLAVSNIYRWDAGITPGSPPVSYVSQATDIGPGFAPRWKGTAALDWHSGYFSANVAGRYLGRYRDYQDFGANNNELGNFWLFDVNSRYSIGTALFENGSRLATTYVAVGAVNVLNRQPQLSYLVPFDVAEADIRGRFVYGQIGVRW